MGFSCMQISGTKGTVHVDPYIYRARNRIKGALRRGARTGRLQNSEALQNNNNDNNNDDYTGAPIRGCVE